MTNKELLLGGVIAALVASFSPLIWKTINHIEANPTNVFIETELRSNYIDIFISNNSDETVDIIKVFIIINKSYIENKIYVEPSKIYTTGSGDTEVISETPSEVKLRIKTHQTIKSGERDRFQIYLPQYMATNTDEIRTVLYDSSGCRYIGRKALK